MAQVVAMHEVDPGHLTAVIDDMRQLGRPTIRAIDIAGTLHAIEGTHRLAAAVQLGLVPLVDVVAEGDADPETIVDGLDIDDRRAWKLADLWEYLGSNAGQHGIYECEVIR